MKKKIFAAILVIIQFSAIAVLAFRSEIETKISFGNTMILLSLFVGFWAIYTMRKSKFTISPIPREKAQLLDDGMYGFIRHPMYLAVLLLCLGFLLQNPDEINILVYAILFADLLVKLHWEEKLLEEKFEGYKNYQLKTKKIIPFIF